MKKRLPILISFILFVALAATCAYWGLQFMKPKARPVAAPPPPPQAEVPPESAATLFGGKLQVATASNFQVKGVISSKSGNGGTVIILTEGQPAQTLGVGDKVVEGVTVKEIHAQYVMLQDNGVQKRLPVPEGKPDISTEGILPLQPDPNASRMTGPALPALQPQQPIAPPQPPDGAQQQPQQQPTEPPQPPVSPQQLPVPPQPGGAGLGPNGEQLGMPPFTRHNK
jgi:general secretion pathway protein C